MSRTRKSPFEEILDKVRETPGFKVEKQRSKDAATPPTSFTSTASHDSSVTHPSEKKWRYRTGYSLLGCGRGVAMSRVRRCSGWDGVLTEA